MEEKEESIKRMKEIMRMAEKLRWIYPSNMTSYPLMQLSEVEKCMLAMVDDKELKTMKKWVKEKVEYKPKIKKCK